MAGKFMVSPDAKSSKGNDLQKELNRRSKGLTLTIKNVTISKEAINAIQTKLFKSRFTIDLDLDSGGIKQQAKKITELGAVDISKTKKAVDSLGDAVEHMDDKKLSGLSREFATQTSNIKAAEQQTKSLGKLLQENMSKLTNWLFNGGSTSAMLAYIKKAMEELRRVDDILVGISKTSNLTDAQLKQLGETAFDSASKFGRSASEYLNAVQEMAHNGFSGQQVEDMAKVSLLAQAAGNLNADMANNYILATNAAYGYQGEAQKLNDVLDGQNMITNRNNVSMSDMAAAMSQAGTAAAGYRVSVEDLSAMIGTLGSVTSLDGNEVGAGIKSILTNLQDISSTEIVGTLDKANASMIEMVNGVKQLRDPISILRDLAKTFNELDEADPLRANILTNIGGKDQAANLSDLLQNMDRFDNMLVDYSDGAGSAAAEAQKTADSWTGSLNKISNSWTALIQNFANRDEVVGVLDLFNSLIQTVDKAQTTLGTFGTIGLGLGLFQGIQNVGRHKMYCLNFFKYADIYMCSLGYRSFHIFISEIH